MFFFFKQKTAYEVRISDWSSEVCSSDLSGAELDSSWDQPNFPRLHVHFPKLGEEAQGSHLRHKQHLAIGVAEHAMSHGRVDGIEMDRDTICCCAPFRPAVAPTGDDSVDQVSILFRCADRTPTHPVRILCRMKRSVLQPRRSTIGKKGGIDSQRA